MRTLCLMLLLCFILFKGNGQPGSLDSTFGNNGIQTTAFFTNANYYNEQGRVVLTDTNGNIFVIAEGDNSYTRIAKYLPDGKLDSSYGNNGYSSPAVVYQYVADAIFQGDKIIVAGPKRLFRFTANGMLDTSFGVNGTVATDLGGEIDRVNTVTLQGSKILVAGYTLASDRGGSFPVFALSRYTADGKLDKSFGVNGIVTTNIDRSAQVNAIALQGNKIIAAGTSGNNGFALARYTANGALDKSFGVHGIVTTNINNYHDASVTSIAILGGKIIAAGYAGVEPKYDFALARYTADGTLDSSFGTNGEVITHFNGSDNKVNSIVLQGDKIVAAGYSGNGSGNADFALARYTVNGKLDASFGMNGKVTTHFSGSDNKAYSVALQGNKIIAAGYTYNSVSSNTDFAFARYTVNGALDKSFGINGKLTGYFLKSDIGFLSTVLQGDKIIAAGQAYTFHNYDFALARYTKDGALDASFGKNGIVTTDFNDTEDQARSLALQGDKIVVAGYSNGNFALARYTADGKLDTSFGQNGKVTTGFTNSDNSAYSIVLQGDKIVAAGYSNGNFALARYTKDGALDASFGKNGIVTTDFNESWDEARSLALQGNKIVVAGNSYNSVDNTSDFALVRYTADGKLDASFGVNGKVTTDFNGNYDGIYSIALQGNKIVVAGRSIYNSGAATDFALARYTANGALDKSFGVNGKVTTSFGSVDGARSIALQGNKIIVAGGGLGSFDIARYTTDGTLDPTFGANGKVRTDVGNYNYVSAIAVHQNRLYAAGGVSSIINETYGVVAAYQLEVPEPAISIAAITVPESKRFAVVTVRLSAPANQLVRVNYNTRNKTAVYPQDYLPLRGTLLFIPHVNTTAKIIIPIIDNGKNEATEQFEIVLTKAWNASIQDSVGVVTIMDDDNAPIAKQENTALHIYANPNPSASTFIVHLLGPDLKQPVRVRVYDVSGRLLEERMNVSIGQTFNLGDQYKPGTYMIEAVQGSKTTQIKVLKTGK